VKAGRWTRKGRSYQLTVWFAFSVSTLAVVFGGLFMVLLALNSRDPEVSTYEYWGADAVTAIVFPAVGALIVSHHPRNMLGWLFCLMGLSSGLAGFASEYATYALVSEPGSLPGAKAAAWLGSWIGTPGFLSVVLIPLLFPDGRPPSRRWWPLVWLAAGVIAAATVSTTLIPGPLEGYPSVENPFGIQGAKAANESLFFAADPILGLALLAGIASLVIRYRRSRGGERQQVKWFTFAVALAPFGLVGNTLFPDLAWLIGGVSVSLIPLAIGIAVLKYRLYDIDLVINRTLVYGVLTACVIGIYVAVVGYLGVLFQTQDNLIVSLLGAGVVAVLFAPLRERLQRVVNRLMYGRRDDPYAVLSGLGERMEAAPEPNAVLPNIAQTLAQTLKLPYVAIRLKQNGEGFVEAAEYGSRPVAEPLVLPLAYRKEEVGELILSPRVGSEGFAKSEVGLLEALARQIGVAAHAVRLNEDLQRSRERLVVAREEERRRLRRDLHDGVGPRLAALTLKLETARNKLSRDPEAAALIGELSEQARETISDVRRSVHALRPPSLDELGLLGALREGAAQYSQNGLWVSVDAPQELPPLPAAVEVACYRIASEAMTNIVRHAGASNCVVRIRLEEATGVLGVEVEDDGNGIREDDEVGVGLHSMRERAEELGGRCIIEPPPEGGTRVVTELPCRLGLAEQTNADTR
jgi:signal transduction histidine kinase